MNRTTLAVAGIAGTALAVLALGQTPRADFDRARFEARRKAQPTYVHSPVYARFGDVTVNLHEITAFVPADVEGLTIIHPGGFSIPVDHEVLEAVVRRYGRTATWRPAGTLPTD